LNKKEPMKLFFVPTYTTMDCRLKFAIALIAIIVCAIIIIWWSQEDFESRRYEDAINISKMAKLLDRNQMSYSSFQRVYDDADPVEYFDVRQLHKAGRLEPANIYNVID